MGSPCRPNCIELHRQQIFSAGPLLSVLQHEKPCVLLIDELGPHRRFTGVADKACESSSSGLQVPTPPLA